MKLRRHASELSLLQAERPLKEVAINLLEPLQKTLIDNTPFQMITGR